MDTQTAGTSLHGKARTPPGQISRPIFLGWVMKHEKSAPAKRGGAEGKRKERLLKRNQSKEGGRNMLVLEILGPQNAVAQVQASAG